MYLSVVRNLQIRASVIEYLLSFSNAVVCERVRSLDSGKCEPDAAGTDDLPPPSHGRFPAYKSS